MTNHSPHTIIIGAGLTGLTAAYSLQQKGVDVLVLEKENRIGGQIHTFHEDGFTFESGPNTGIIAHPKSTIAVHDSLRHGVNAVAI